MTTALDSQRSTGKLLRAVEARLLVRGGKPPTDFELLEGIYKRHRHDFEGQSEVPVGFLAKIIIPIDIPAIAQDLGVDANSVFGRLYYHLDPKYAEPAFQGRARKALFSPVVGDDQNCVNFPLLEAVLAGLWQERRRDLWALGTAVFSLGVAFAALMVSAFH